jgi:hypothetical protein
MFLSIQAGKHALSLSPGPNKTMLTTAAQDIHMTSTQA